MFQQVMYAPHKPLVLIVATPQGQRAAVSDKLHEIATKWRLRTRRTSGDGAAVAVGAGARDVVFTWMDAGQWGKWMKDMYGIKAGTEPEIIVADHEVSDCVLRVCQTDFFFFRVCVIASGVLQQGRQWTRHRVQLGERRVRP